MIADEVVDFLAFIGVGTAGIDIFANNMPDSPDTCVCVYDVNTWRLAAGSALAMDNQGVTIDIRSNDMLDVKAKFKIIRNNLMAFGGKLNVGGQEVTHVDCDVAPTLIGADQDKRYLWTSRWRLLVESDGDVYRN